MLATGDLARLCEIAGDAVPVEKLAEAIGGAGVLLPAELRARVARLRDALLLRPEVSSIAAMAGAMYLARDWSGPAYDEGAIESALSRGSPRRGAELLQRVREKARELEQTLVFCCDAIDTCVAFQAGLGPYQDVGELVALREVDALMPCTRRRLAAFAYLLDAVMTAHGRRGRAELVRVPATAHRVLVGMAHQGGGPTLTEHAWKWILEEKDPAVLGLLLDLGSCERGSDETNRLHRALLENRVLCVEVARMMRDEAAMAEGEALVEDAGRERKRERSSGAHEEPRP